MSEALGAFYRHSILIFPSFALYLGFMKDVLYRSQTILQKFMCYGATKEWSHLDSYTYGFLSVCKGSQLQKKLKSYTKYARIIYAEVCSKTHRSSYKHKQGRNCRGGRVPPYFDKGGSDPHPGSRKKIKKFK